MMGAHGDPDYMVHCRIGSSEKHHAGGFALGAVHCRIGSSENAVSADQFRHIVHCRIGSSEILHVLDDES